MKLLVAERNPLVLRALGDLVSHDSRFEIAGTCDNGRDLIEIIGCRQPAFDIALAGWNLADMNAAKLLAELQFRKLDAPVVVFCEASGPDILKICLRLGARGFCYQFDDPRILFDTLVAVGDGRICIPRINLSELSRSPLSELTVRERELLVALSEGWTNLQIANRTGISENTVKYHLKNLYEKLEVRNRAMATALFARERATTP